MLSAKTGRRSLGMRADKQPLATRCKLVPMSIRRQIALAMLSLLPISGLHELDAADCTRPTEVVWTDCGL